MDLYFHQLELDKATPAAEQASSSAGASMEAPSANTSSADVYSLPGQEWTEEDWQIWREVLKCSGKSRGQKRKQEMFRRFKFLRQQGKEQRRQSVKECGIPLSQSCDGAWIA